MNWLAIAADLADSINAWIVNHKELLTVVAVPLLVWSVSFLTNRSVEKRSQNERWVERGLVREMKLSEYRQKWINDLRNDISEHQSICLASGLYQDDKLEIPKEKGYRLSELANRILLRVNPADPDYEALSLALAVDRLRTTTEDVPNAETLSIAQRILKREWERLKQDLIQIEKSTKQ